MKCPNCLHTMECISEIHKVPSQPWRERMNLHCAKPIGDARRGCGFGGFMGVITEDPKEWICHEYRFNFLHGNKGYTLRSYDHAVDPYRQSFYRGDEAKTILHGYGGGDLITLPYFIPLSTSDDMHERAWDLFHRLRNLVIYS
jgi:hypothetical protein